MKNFTCESYYSTRYGHRRLQARACPGWAGQLKSFSAGRACVRACACNNVQWSGLNCSNSGATLLFKGVGRGGARGAIAPLFC